MMTVSDDDCDDDAKDDNYDFPDNNNEMVTFNSRFSSDSSSFT